MALLTEVDLQRTHLVMYSTCSLPWYIQWLQLYFLKILRNNVLIYSDANQTDFLFALLVSFDLHGVFNQNRLDVPAVEIYTSRMQSAYKCISLQNLLGVRIMIFHDLFVVRELCFSAG